MNKIRTITVLFICFFAGVANALDIPGDVTFFGLEKYTQELKKNVFSVQILDDSGKGKIIGSGFLIIKNNLVLGVTCYHVISNFLETKEGKLVLNRPLYAGLVTDQEFKRFGFEILGIDKKNDFALLLMKKDKPEDSVILKNLVLSETYLGSNDLIVEGKGVLIIGYPLGLGIEYNQNFPVAKFGIVAQYTKQNYFLLDAIANLGNSGSPVYSLKEGKIIGMVTSFKNDAIPLFDASKNLVAALPYNSGLSSAIPIELIKNALEKMPQLGQNTTSSRTK